MVSNIHLPGGNGKKSKTTIDTVNNRTKPTDIILKIKLKFYKNKFFYLKQYLQFNY